MSQENVAIVRHIVEHMSDWDVVKELLSPDVELDQTAFPDGAVYHGRDAFRDFFRRWFGTWDDLDVRAERFIDAGERGVVVLLKLSGRGKASGVALSVDAADVWELEGGVAVRLTGYIDRREALEAAGLAG